MSVAMLCAALRAKCTQIDAERKTAQLNIEIMQDIPIARHMTHELDKARHKAHKLEIEYYEKFNKICHEKHYNAAQRKKFKKHLKHAMHEAKKAEHVYEHKIHLLHRRDAILNMCMEKWRAIASSCATMFDSDSKMAGDEVSKEFGDHFQA